MLLMAAFVAARQLESVHIEGTVEGRIRGDFLRLGSTGEVALEDLTMSADVDLRTGAYRSHFEAPTVLGISGDSIRIGGTSGMRSSIGGDHWQQLEVPDAFASVPPWPRLMVDLEELLDSVGLTVGGVTTCGDDQCQRVRVTIDPSDLVEWQASGPLGRTPPWVDSIYSASIEVEIRTSDRSPHSIRFELDGSQVSTGNTGRLSMDLVFSRFDEPVDITAPDPADVTVMPTFPLTPPSTPRPSIPQLPTPTPSATHPDLDCSGLRSVVADATGLAATPVSNESGGCGFSLAGRSGAPLGADSLVVMRREPNPSIVESLGGSLPSTAVEGLGDCAVWVAQFDALCALEGSSRLLRPDIRPATRAG